MSGFSRSAYSPSTNERPSEPVSAASRGSSAPGFGSIPTPARSGGGAFAAPALEIGGGPACARAVRGLSASATSTRPAIQEEHTSAQGGREVPNRGHRAGALLMTVQRKRQL